MFAAAGAGLLFPLATLSAEMPAPTAFPEAAPTVRALDADLLAHESATAVLTRWCAAGHLAVPPVIRAVRDASVDKSADRYVRTLLHVTADERIRYRHVSLVCGDHLLSRADNWYVPDRLTPEMNRRLDQTDTPFGLVVQPLDFHRVRLTSRVLSLGPIGASSAGDILRHEALLIAASGKPISFVEETYSTELLLVSPPDR